MLSKIDSSIYCNSQKSKQVKSCKKFWVSRCKLVYVKWINNKVQLYNTEKYFNILSDTIMENNIKKECIYVCIPESFDVQQKLAEHFKSSNFNFIKVKKLKKFNCHTNFLLSKNLRIVVVQSLNSVQVFTTPLIAACPAHLSFTISWSLLRFMSIVLAMPSNHFILLLLFSVFPSIKVSSNELALHIRQSKY